MELKRETYTLSKAILEDILDHLHDHWFWYDDEGDSYNEDDTIELTKKVEAYLEKQHDLS